MMVMSVPMLVLADIGKKPADLPDAMGYYCGRQSSCVPDYEDLAPPCLPDLYGECAYHDPPHVVNFSKQHKSPSWVCDEGNPESSCQNDVAYRRCGWFFGYLDSNCFQLSCTQELIWGSCSP
jgi:hypothetical protein